MARRRIWALVRKRSRGGVAHNAGPHLTQHETDHHIRIPWVLGSHENERSCEVFELPVPLLDDAATRLLAPLPFHYYGSRYSRRRQQMLITGYASSSSCFPRFPPSPRLHCLRFSLMSSLSLLTHQHILHLGTGPHGNQIRIQVLLRRRVSEEWAIE